MPLILRLPGTPETGTDMYMRKLVAKIMETNPRFIIKFREIGWANADLLVMEAFFGVNKELMRKYTLLSCYWQSRKSDSHLYMIYFDLTQQ